jgi:hypothetical protein
LNSVLAAASITVAVVCCAQVLLSSSNKMFTARKKIVKEKGAEPDSFEESVAQVRLQ